MKYQINALFEPDIIWMGEINRQMMRLERKLAVLPSSGRANLDCSLWRGADSSAGVNLTLDFGDACLNEKALDSSEVTATKKAFDALNYQIETYLNRLRERDFWGRASRNRRDTDSDSAAADSPDSKQKAVEAIDRHLTDLYNFARGEIADRQARGDILAGDLTAEEIVDEAALKTIKQFDERPADMEFESWLRQLILDAIKRRREEIQFERERIMRLEDDGWVATSAAQASFEDEIFDYFQPDEVLRLEDLIADGRVPTPEDVLSRRELQQYINQTLAKLPRRWREAFILYSAEGLSLEETARVMRVPIETARRSVEMAREFLRECLVEAGFDLAKKQSGSASTVTV